MVGFLDGYGNSQKSLKDTVTIVNVVPDKWQVIGKNRGNDNILISCPITASVTRVPQIGEVWSVELVGNRWTIDQKLLPRTAAEFKEGTTIIGDGNLVIDQEGNTVLPINRDMLITMPDGAKVSLHEANLRLAELDADLAQATETLSQLDQTMSQLDQTLSGLNTDLIEANKDLANLRARGNQANQIPNGMLEDGKTPWHDALTRNVTDKPTGLTASLRTDAGQGSLPLVNGDDSWITVVPGGQYLWEIWLKANKPGSVLILELQDQNGNNAEPTTSPTSASLGAVFSGPDHLFNGTVGTDWQKYAALLTLKPGTTRVRLGTAHFNHSSGTEQSAMVWLAGARLQQINSGVLIADNAITSEKIVSEAVIADKIAANAIGVNHIAANAVTAGKIDAFAVNTRELASEAVTAEKVLAKSLGADQIAAKSITTSELILAPGNIFPDPYLYAPKNDPYKGWWADQPNNVQFLGIAGMVGNVVKFTLGSAAIHVTYRLNDMEMKLEAGLYYRYSLKINRSTTNANQLYIYLRHKKTDGSFQAQLVGTVPQTPETTNQFGVVTGTFKAPADMVGPSTLTFAFAPGTADETAMIGETTVTPAADASLIVDGSIYGRHVVAGDVWARLVEAEAMVITAPGWVLERTNLCENPRMESAEGWSVLRRSSTPANFYGPLNYVYDAGGAGLWLGVVPSRPNLRPGGGKITIGCSLWSNEGLPVGVNLVAWDAGNAVVYDSYGSAGSAVRTSSLPRLVSTYDVPATAVRYEVRFRAVQTRTAVAAVACSMVTVEQGSEFTDGSFFYGSTPATAEHRHTWQGTPNASPSYQWVATTGSRITLDAAGITLRSPDGWDVSGSLGNPEDGLDYLGFGSTRVSAAGIQTPQIAADQIRLAGDDLAARLDRLPRGVVGRAYRATNTNQRKSMTRILETNAVLSSARRYRISLQGVSVWVPSGGATTLITGVYVFTLPFTSWGAASRLGWDSRAIAAGEYRGWPRPMSVDYTPPADGPRGFVATIETPGAFSYLDAVQSPVQLVIEDIGRALPDTSAVWMDPAESGTGSTGPSAPVQRYVKTYAATGVGSWWRSTGARDSGASDAVQGSYDGSAGSARDGGWSFPDMSSDLAGATIESIKLTAANVSWYYHGAGGTGQFHLHGGTSVFGSKPATTGYVGQIAGWPEASGQDIWVPAAYFDGFRNGTHRGFLMSAGDNYSLTHYGRFHPTAYITVTYTK